MGTPRRYSDEFKQEVVAQAASGRNIAQLARELDLSPGLIYKWRERYRVVDARLEASEGRAEAAEVRRLKRELEVVRQERDILKKAIQVFSRGER
jgi:transposase